MGAIDDETMMAQVQRTIEDVLDKDAVFRAEAAAAPALDPAAEGAALKTLLTDEGTCARCKDVTGFARWSGCEGARAAAVAMSDAELGAKVAAVVQELDAAHLRPTGIRQRLQSGVDAACHGIMTLVTKIK